MRGASLGAPHPQTPARSSTHVRSSVGLQGKPCVELGGRVGGPAFPGRPRESPPVDPGCVLTRPACPRCCVSSLWS